MSLSSQNTQKEYNFLSKKTKNDTQSNDLLTIPQLSNIALNHIDQINNFDALPPNKHHISNNEVQQFLSTLSIREKYENLLTRRELTLPPKYQLLLKKQTVLDTFLSIENKDNHIEKIRNDMSKKHHLALSTEDFKRILYVAPFYYIYQSKKLLHGNIELFCIDIPNDYDKRLKVS